MSPYPTAAELAARAMAEGWEAPRAAVAEVLCDPPHWEDGVPANLAAAAADALEWLRLLRRSGAVKRWSPEAEREENAARLLRTIAALERELAGETTP